MPRKRKSAVRTASRQAPPKRASGFTRFMLFLMLLVLLGAAAGGAYIWQYLNTPFALPQMPTAFVLERGTTLKVAARQLAAQGVVEQPLLLTWIGRLRGDAARIKAGSYELNAPVTPLQLLAKLTDGDVSSGALVIVEGWNWRQLKAALAKNDDLRHDSAALDDAAIVAAIGEQASSPEGLFFPDTYHFAKQSSDLEVLKRAHLLLRRKLDAAWQGRAAGLALNSPYEALILASIVEKETGRASDRAMISAVFNNRLRIGMRLQTDPSVIYGLGERYDGTIHKVDLETDTPYNTYTRPGLTPTPIAMPGEAALEAALNPAPSKALYFVAKGDGSSYFSSTLAEHNQAVRRYQLGGR
jgi:UPF0755 protein